jgi:hypothetical protein
MTNSGFEKSIAYLKRNRNAKTISVDKVGLGIKSLKFHSSGF